MKGQKKINGILYKFNLELINPRVKESLKYAIDYFKGKEIVACEVGVYLGEFSTQINKRLNVKKFYLVDPYISYDEYELVDSNGPMKWKENAHRLNKKGNEIWIEKTSDEAIGDIPDKIDYCYIDGNHAYKYVLNDLNAYWKLINEGGILAGHDINQKDVSDAVMKFVKDNDLDISFGDRRDWWIIKRKAD